MAILNLGTISAIFVGTSAPSNTDVLWRDTNFSPEQVKYYDTSQASWITLTSALEVVSSAVSLATSGDGATTGRAIVVVPSQHIHIRVDGYFADVSFGDKTGDCYWSGDGGTTSRNFADLIIGDILYWNGGTIAPTELTTSSVIKLYQK